MHLLLLSTGSCGSTQEAHGLSTSIQERNAYISPAGYVLHGWHVRVPVQAPPAVRHAGAETHVPQAHPHASGVLHVVETALVLAVALQESAEVPVQDLDASWAAEQTLGHWLTEDSAESWLHP